MKRAIYAVAALFLVAVSAGVHAHHGEEAKSVGNMVVSHVWTQERSAVADAMNVYMTIENQGDEPERLVAASASFASGAVFEVPVVNDSGSFTLQQVSSIEIAPGARVTLQPGSAHIQLTDVQRHFHGGDHFHMTLAFENAGELEIDVDVERMSDEHDHDEPAT